MIDARQKAFPFRELMLLALAFACGGQVLGADHSTPNWRATLERIAAEENCAFFDMTGPLGSFIEKSQMARGAFMRDVVHANDRGKAVLGELLNRWFAP